MGNHNTVLTRQIHDPTDAIMEYSAQYSDPVYYAGSVLAALDRYLAANTANAARLSGFVLGLTALGRLVMRLPKEVAEDEAERFAGILYMVRTITWRNCGSLTAPGL